MKIHLFYRTRFQVKEIQKNVKEIITSSSKDIIRNLQATEFCDISLAASELAGMAI